MPNRTNTDRKKRKIFEDSETLTLMNLWASDKIQKQFSSTTRHNLIYESLSRQLKECGYSSTASEIKSKILNMKTEYRSKKPKSGSSTPDWPYFCIMHKVLGQRDAGNDDLLDESLANEEAADSDANQSENPYEDDPPSLPGESTELQSKPNELRQGKLSTPKLRKISRPPRRARSQEDKLIVTLVATDQAFQRRLDAMHDLETLKQKRDDLVANSMCRFLNAFAVLAENSSAQGTQPFPMPLPTIDITTNTADTAVVNSELIMKECTSFVQEQVEADVTLSKQLTKSRKTKSTKSTPSPVLMEDEDTYENSTVEYLDDEMDMDFPSFIQSFEADNEENNDDNDPIIEYLNSEEDINIPAIFDNIAAKKPRIVLHERIQPPLKIKKKFEKLTPKTQNNCKSSTFTGYNSSLYKSVDRRLKPGNIIVYRADS